MNEYIKNLSQRIALIKKPKIGLASYSGDGNKLSDSWNAAELFSILVYKAEPKPYFTFDDLTSLRDKFEQKQGVSIDLDKLIDLKWVRVVHGNEVRLPSFLQELLRSFPKGIEQRNQDFFKRNQNELTFLKEIHQLGKNKDDRSLLLEKEEAKSIIEEHQSVYKNCPSFESFIHSGFLEEEADSSRLVLTLSRGSFNNSTSPKLFESNQSYIFSLVWEKILVDGKTIFDWLRRVVALRVYAADIIQYASKNSKESFIKQAWQVLRNESDLQFSNSEIDKCWWDNEGVGRYYGGVFPEPSAISYKLDNSSLFNLYDSMLDLTSIDQSSLFWHQRVRLDFGLLISILIENDSPFKNYRDVKRLFDVSRTSPYILWKTAYIIKTCYPEIIPYLLQDKDLSAIGMHLLSQMDINPIALSRRDGVEGRIEKAKYLSEMWSKCLLIVSHALHNCNNYEIGAMLVDITKPILHKVFQEKESLELRSIYLKRYQRSLNCFWGENDKEGLSYYVSNAFLQHRLKGRSDVLDAIVTKVRFGDRILPHSNLKSISLWKYKLLVDLLGGAKRHVLSWENFNEELISSIFSIYEDDFKELKITFQSGLLRSIKEDWVVWFRDVANYNLIDWDSFLLEINRTKKLDDFFVLPRSVKVDNSIKDNEKTQCFKIRFHLSILLESYHRIVKMKLKSLESKTLSDALKMAIVSLVNKYGAVIFKPDIEEQMNRSINLFAYVFELSNFFDAENRLLLIKDIVSFEISFSQYIIMYNAFHSEEDKSVLIKEVEKIDVEKFINSRFWLPQIETALIEAVNSGLFIKQAKKILESYEGIVERKKLAREKQELIFEIKLILALHEKDEHFLDRIEIPKPKHRIYGKRAYDYGARKKFIKGLIYLNQSKLEEASKLFSPLARTNKEIPNYQLIKLLADLRILLLEEKTIINEGKIKSEIQKIYLQTIDIENECKRKGEEKGEGSEEGAYEVNWVLQILLTCCKELDLAVDFYNIYYARLDAFQRIHPNYLEISIPFLIGQGKKQEAIALLMEAKSCHAGLGTMPPFIIALEKLIYAEDIPEYYAALRNHYKDILMLPLDEMIKTVPRRVNPFSKELDEFILFELCFAINQLLFKLKTIEAVFGGIDLKSVKEDYFTDLIELVLNAQLKSFCYKLDSQSRKGASGTGKGMGEIDLGLGFNVKDIVIEAVRVYSYQTWNTNKKEVVKHIRKTFNYSPSRDMFYNLVYYQNEDFNKDWVDFVTNLLPSIKFPKGFSLKGNVEEIKELGHNSMKVALTRHENNLKFYHIFIDLGYLTR